MCYRENSKHTMSSLLILLNSSSTQTTLINTNTHHWMFHACYSRTETAPYKITYFFPSNYINYSSFTIQFNQDIFIWGKFPNSIFFSNKWEPDYIKEYVL